MAQILGPQDRKPVRYWWHAWFAIILIAPACTASLLDGDQKQAFLYIVAFEFAMLIWLPMMIFVARRAPPRDIYLFCAYPVIAFSFLVLGP